MKKKRIILASILGAAALFAGASIVTAVVSNNANRIQENVNDGIEESDLAEDSVFGTGIESIIVNKEVKKKESTDALLTPVIGRQYAYDSTAGKVSIRFIAAVSRLDVDAVWRRTLYNSDGSVNRTGTYKSTKAYTTLAYKYKNDKNEDVTETQTAEEFAGEGYNYFVLYTLKNIPISDCSSIEASLEISNDAYTEVSKTGSVATTSTADISSYEASLTIDGNYSYKSSSNTSAGNGQYINGKLKTIYSTNDTSLNTDYISLGLTKTYTNTTESSNYYYNDSDFSQRISFSGFGQTAGAHTIKVQCGATAASYDIYVLATDCAYQDANNNYVVTVDKSYTGIIGAVSGTNGNMFTTISQALEFLQNDTFVPTNANKILKIGAGYYKEKLEITTPNLTIKGSGTIAKGTYSSDENYNATDYAKATIIEYDTLFGQDAPGLSDVNYKHTTDSTQTVAVRDTATNCKIDGVTISNAWNCTEYFTAKGASSEHRALALLVQADAFQMNNCALLGYQDTLELMTGRQYFKSCYISGRTDYIFGTNNITLFNECTIHTIESNGFVTAFKGINKGSDNPNYATVFKSCTFEGDLGVTGTTLARPWGAYANVAFINCAMDSTISTEGYDDENKDTQGKRYVKMNAEPTDSTVNFVEYGNTGAGAISTAVNGMSMLDADTAKNYYTYSTLFGKTNGNVSFALAWDPVNGYEQDYNTYYIFDKSSRDTGTSYTYTGNTIQNGSASLGNMTINASASGAKLSDNGNSAQFNSGTILSIAVSAGTTVTVNSYPGYHSYNVTGSSDTTVKIATADTSTYYFASAQTVYITSRGTSYLTSVVINSTNQSDEAELDSISSSGQITNFTVGEELDLSGNIVYASTNVGYKYLISISDYSVTVKNSSNETVDVSDGFSNAGTYTVYLTYNDVSTSYSISVIESEYFESNKEITFGENGNYSSISKLNLENASIRNDGDDKAEISGTIIFKVRAGSRVLISGHSGYTNYTIGNGTTTTDAISDTSYAYFVSSDSTITITCGSGNYLYSINILCAYTESTTFTLGTSNTNLVNAINDSGNAAQNKIVVCDSMIIDTRNGGKIRLNSTNNAQINKGSKISFTVQANTLVTIGAYSTNDATNYTINGVATNAKTFSRFYETTQVVEIEIVSGNPYLETITITPNATKPSAATLSSITLGGYSVNEMQVGDDYDLSNITIKAIYSDNSVYAIDKVDCTIVSTIDKTKAGVYTVTVTYDDGVTEKSASFNVTYVGTVSNTISSNYDFVLASSNGSLSEALGTSGKVEGSTLQFGKFYIDASSGKFALNGDNVQYNSGTKIVFTVAAGATVTVTGYPGSSNYSITGLTIDNTQQIKTVTYNVETEVTILGTGNAYLKEIEITF